MSRWRRRAALVVACLSTLAAGPKGAVVRVEGDVITVNRGQQDQVQRGDHWFVYRAGQPVAELQVEQVGEYSSLARVTRKLAPGVVAGDIVNSTPFNEAPPVADRGGPPEAGGPVAANQAARPAAAADLKTLEERYRERFEARTDTHEFRQVAGAPRSYNDIYPGMNLWNVFQTVDLISSGFVGGAFYTDPSLIIMSATSQIAANRARDQLYDAVDAQVQIQATYWDSTLMNAYADMVAASEGKGNPERIAQIKSNLVAQKGVDRNRVFEVRVRNIGRVDAKLSPFHWHMFLGGPDGTLIKPERYDQILDQTLSPGQELTGNVYFPNGPTTGGKTIVLFEDIFGDKAQMDL